MKSYTDIEQSKKLAEILPKETADFHFRYYSVLECWWDIPHYRTASHIKDLPCWSLAALLEVLPKIHKLKPILDLEENSILYSGTNLDVRADNIIDACVEMIITLKEREKQANNANKVEPKFKVGNWVVENEPNNYARFIQILEIVNVQGKGRYRISRDIHNDEDIVDFDFVEKYYHKFDIKDARDGDVFASCEVVFIFEAIYGVWLYCHCSAHKDGSFNADSYNLLTDKYFGEVQPATKEQHDLLFQKMKEAGYEFDADKKEPKKL